MRLLSVILLVSVIGCGPIPPVAFTTPCGMEVMSTGYEADPYDVANLERTAVAYRLVACGKLQGWRLYTQQDEAWDSPRHGIRIAGVTYCRSQTVEIGSGPIRQSAYAHELVHVGECPWENGAHEGWATPDASGVTTYQRIEAVRR